MSINKHIQLWQISLVAALLWTIAVAFSLLWNIYNQEQQVLLIAENDAKASLQRDLAFRKWSTEHGGVYVFVDEKTQPSPYLVDVPERDVVTQSGRVLTLQNPAMSLREIKQTQDDLYGQLARITGLKYRNPINKPDEWEIKALGIIARSKQDYSEVVEIDGKPYLRRIQPMWMEKGCIKCHDWTGIKVGELRGATDVAVPLEPLRTASNSVIKALTTTHAMILLIGWAAIGFGNKYSRFKMDEAISYQSKLEQLAHDDLTGLLTRRRFFELANQEVARAVRYARPLSIMMIDIDYFKEINDAYGHAVGDMVLTNVSEIFTTELRKHDIIGRIGGDELVALMPETKLVEAKEIADRIRNAIELTPLMRGESEVRFTISVGIATIDEEAKNIETLLKRADEMLYKSKDLGRNKVS